MPATTTAPLLFTPERDKYGRSTHVARDARTYRSVGVVVRLPKVAIEAGQLPYLVNHWNVPVADGSGQTKVTTHRTLADAKASLADDPRTR